MASTLNISMDQGSSFFRQLEFIDTDTLTPIDMTGYTFRGQGRIAYGSPTAAFTFAFDVLDQTLFPGKVDMTLEPTDTESLRLTQSTPFVYDVERISPVGDVTRLFQGNFTISPEATKNE